MTDLKEGFKTRLRSIIGGLKGKRLQEEEVKQSREEQFAATKRYQVARGPLEEWGKQGYLICNSETIPLQPGFLVGRGMSCHLKLTDPGCSRVHASFSRAGEGWLLKDNSSRNGTFLNGQPIQSAVLKSGDRIQIGQTVLVYEER